MLWLRVAEIVQPFANRRGAAMVEYGILAGLIVIVSVAMLTALGTRIDGNFNAVVTAL